MQRIIAAVNQKGGTGKTTTVVNTAHGLALEGKRVLIIDCDPQGNVATSFGLEPQRSLYHVLVANDPPEQCITEVRPGLWVLPSDNTLSRAEQILYGEPARESALKRRLAHFTDFDFVLLDCPPSLNLLNQNALMYANEVFIPVSMEYLALVGVRQILETLKLIKEVLGHEISVTAVIPTFYDKRNRKSEEIIDNLREAFGSRVMRPIRTNVAISQAPSAHQTIFEYAPYSPGGLDYNHLIKQVLGHEQQESPRLQSAQG